ncbi:MAG: aminopeptidase P N-terminal domain-containing protein [Gemmatimonadota bacterium]
MRPLLRSSIGFVVALALVPSGGEVSAQTPDVEATPEQRYGDWVRRLDFRPQEYQYRRSNMMRLLKESGGGVFIAPSSDGTTHGSTFRQLEDFWYYTGLEVPNSILVLDAENDRSILFLPGSDYRFENPGRPNDFPGRPLLDDFQLRSIAGIEEYRDAVDFDRFLSQRVRSRTPIRVNGGRGGGSPASSYRPSERSTRSRR